MQQLSKHDILVESQHSFVVEGGARLDLYSLSMICAKT